MPLYRAELIRRKKPLIGPQIHDVSQVLYLPFDHDDGAYARDRSGYRNHGTIYGATGVAGEIGGALDFDGVDDYVEVADDPSLDLIDAVTLAAWIYARSFPAEGAYDEIIDKEWTTSYRMHLRTETGPVTYLGCGVRLTLFNDDTTPLSLNTWYHVAVTYDREYLRLWVNGVNVKSLAKTESMVADTYPVRIGSYRGIDEFFHGIIDEVRIYNRALSQSEIKRLMYLRGV